jgi:hypothetical protein
MPKCQPTSRTGCLKQLIYYGRANGALYISDRNLTATGCLSLSL